MFLLDWGEGEEALNIVLLDGTSNSLEEIRRCLAVRKPGFDILAEGLFLGRGPFWRDRRRRIGKIMIGKYMEVCGAIEKSVERGGVGNYIILLAWIFHCRARLCRHFAAGFAAAFTTFLAYGPSILSCRGASRGRTRYRLPGVYYKCVLHRIVGLRGNGAENSLR